MSTVKVVGKYQRAGSYLSRRRQGLCDSKRFVAKKLRITEEEVKRIERGDFNAEDILSLLDLGWSVTGKYLKEFHDALRQDVQLAEALKEAQKKGRGFGKGAKKRKSSS